MSWYEFVWVHVAWGPLCFLYLDIWSLFGSGKFLVIISSNTFSIPFSFWDPYNVNINTLDIIPELFSFLNCSHLKKVFFLFALLIRWFPLFCLLDHLCIILYHLVCFIPSRVFYFSIKFFIFFLLSILCGLWDLIPWPGVELRPLTVKAWSPNHWTPGNS